MNKPKPAKIDDSRVIVARAEFEAIVRKKHPEVNMRRSLSGEYNAFAQAMWLGFLIGRGLV